MKNLILITCIILFCSNSCDDPPFVEKFYSIIVENNSASEIRVYLADELAIKQYPDISLPEIKPSLQNAPVNNNCKFYSRTPWEENFKKLRADTLSVFIIDNETYKNETWENIRTNYKILKRFDLSIQDLKVSDYKIIYE